ncbi:MAG: hypothetical protein LC667_18150 [Thioalkalivibrio sp.]|nr:hypothetical protein [Thioalkalivibrio sp.]
MDVIREGGAVEARAKQLDEIIAAADTAQAHADDLAGRAERARSAVADLRDALRPVYADPAAVASQMQKFRETHTPYELYVALVRSPEDFGALKATTVYPLWGMAVVSLPDYSEAHAKASGVAAPLESAMFALPRRPRPGEVEAARETADKLRQGGQEARRERQKLPQSHTYEGEAAALMRSQAFTLGPDQLARQLRPLLERDPHALAFARRIRAGIRPPDTQWR